MHFQLIISVSVKVKKNLNSIGDPCNEDTTYNFHACVESFFYKHHGCQYPWNVYQNLSVPVCKNLTIMKDLSNLLMVDRREKYSNLQRITYTNKTCKMPCVTTRYILKYRKEKEFEDGDPKIPDGNKTKYSLRVLFENFVIEEQKEFLACDKTCLIGEFGGNLGFFLGGSILALFDIIILVVMKVDRLVRICKNSKTTWNLRQSPPH